MLNWEVNFSTSTPTKDGHPSASIVLKQNFGSNASKVIDGVKEKLTELEQDFPPGMKYEINYDVSKFVGCFHR